MQYQFALPNYKPILAAFVEQRLSQRMRLPEIDHNEPQKFIGEIYLNFRCSEVTLIMEQQEKNCILNFFYDDPQVLSIIENLEKEITEIWKGYCQG